MADSERRLVELLTPCANACARVSHYGGNRGDGVYLMCEDALQPAGTISAALSFGVRDADKWGYDISMRLNVPVHGYDCFDAGPVVRRTVPLGVNATFHRHCIGARTETIDGRSFLSVDDIVRRHRLPRSSRQRRATGAAAARAASHLLMKMDVEGFEFEAVPAMSPGVLRQFRTLVFEVHGITRPNVPIMGQCCKRGAQRGPYNATHGASEAVRFFEHLERSGFVLTTVHSNNLWGASRMAGKVVPNLMDVTLVNRDALPADFTCERMTPSQLYQQHLGHPVWRGEELPSLVEWPASKTENWHATRFQGDWKTILAGKRPDTLVPRPLTKWVYPK